MEALRFIGMALIAIIMRMNFVACSGDDEEANVTIRGTRKYTSDSDESMCSSSLTFKSNGSLVWADEEKTSSNRPYTPNGSNLKIILNQDDYIEGAITISKGQATYKYAWHDYAGEWDDDAEYTTTLAKQQSRRNRGRS